MFMMFVYDRFACSIPDPSSTSVIVIGGFNTQNKVSRYSRAGLYCVLYCTVYCTTGTGERAGWRTCHRSMWGDGTMGVEAMCPVVTW